MSVEIDGVNNIIKADTISEVTSANGVSIDGLTIKDGGITATTGSIVFNEASADVDFRIEGNGDANAFFLDGEVDRIYLGHNANTNINGLDARLQISGTDFDKSSASLIRYSADANPPSIGFAKSRNASIAGNTIVQDGDFLGRIRFAGADGGDFGNVAAQIDCQVDGTPGVNDMPGRLSFSTAADGGTGATERVRIHQGGVMSASQGIALGVGTANTASNVLNDYEEGTYTPTVTCEVGGSYGLDTGSDTLQYTKIGRKVTVQGMLSVTSESSPNGNLRLSLPFTAPSLTDDSDYALYAMGLSNHGSTITGTKFLFVQPGSVAWLYCLNSDGSSNYIDHTEVDTNFQFHCNFTYLVS